MKAIEYIRLIGKEFASVNDSELELWVEMIRPMVSKKQFGKLYEQGIAFLTAHRMKMAGVGGGQAEEGGLQMGIADTLRVASYSEGSTSISFNNAAAAGTADAELALTEYGIQYMNLRRLVIVPIRCSGEAR